MRLFCLICSGLLIMLSASCGDIDAGGPTAPDPQVGGEYFPLAAGNNWRFVRSGFGTADSSEYTLTGVSIVSVDRVTSHAEGFELFVVSTSGNDTLHFAEGDVPQEPFFSTEYIHKTGFIVESFRDTTAVIPQWTIPLPLQEGDTWLYRTRPMDVYATVLTVAGDYETPAGSFSDVLEIETPWMPDSASVRTVVRHSAPGVGVVAVTDELVPQSAGGDSHELVDVLRAYNIN